MASNTIEEVELPMPIDDLIKVGMLVDTLGHGCGMTIGGISVALCPRRDAAAEGTAAAWWVGEDNPATAAEVPQIEAALLPYAVFGLTHDGHQAGWCYGRQITRVYEKGDEHEG